MLSVARMNETKLSGVQGLAGTDAEAVFYELAVFRIYGPLAYLCPVVAGVVE